MISFAVGSTMAAALIVIAAVNLKKIKLLKQRKRRRKDGKKF